MHNLFICSINGKGVTESETVIDALDSTASFRLLHSVPCHLPQAVVTRWGSDPMSYGSYSNVTVGCRGPEDYDILAEPVAGRVFFAGEATTRKYPATMHGAFLSGLREAANISGGFAKDRQVVS